MESVAEMMIQLAEEKCDNPGIKYGLEIALRIISTSGYYNLDDWEGMSQEEQEDAVRAYFW